MTRTRDPLAYLVLEGDDAVVDPAADGLVGEQSGPPRGREVLWVLLLSALVAMPSQVVSSRVAVAGCPDRAGGAVRPSTLGVGGYLAAKLDLTRMPVVVALAVLAPSATIVLAVTRLVAAVVAQVVLALLLAVVAIHAGWLPHALIIHGVGWLASSIVVGDLHLR